MITDVIQKHADLGIELRVVENLWPLWDLVIASTLCFSGIRLRNAAPRPTTNRLADGRRPYTLHWFDTFGSPPGAPGTGEWQGDALKFHQEGSGNTIFELSDGGLIFKIEMDVDGKGMSPIIVGKYRRAEAGAESPRRVSLNRIV